MILSIAMMVQWMGDYHKSEALSKAGTAMEAAVDRVLENPAKRTADLGGTLGCKDFGDCVAEAIETL
jgi:3-isopropylmalate dehydrogenase